MKPLTNTQHKDMTKKKYGPIFIMNLVFLMLNKILAHQMQTYIKIIHHDQVGVIPEMQARFKTYKLIM